MLHPVPSSATRGGLPAAVICVLAALSAVVFATPATALEPSSAAGQEDGDAVVAGVVRDVDGEVLPGTTVTLTGPLGDAEADGEGEASAAERTTVTDARGRFAFEGVGPGRYRLRAELGGFRPYDDGVAVAAGEAVEVEVVLRLETVEERVVVEAGAGEPPSLEDREETAGRATVRKEVAEHLPLPAEQITDALPLIPGVVRGPDGLISVGGTLPSDSILLLNGLDLTDPYTGRFRMRLPLEAVDRMELYSGVYPATFGQLLGGIVDIATAGGGEEWAFEFNNFVPRPRIEDGTIRGFEAVSPRFRVSGPLVPGELYLSQAGEYRFDRIDVNDVPRNFGPDDLEFEGWESVTQLDWYPDDRHHLRFTGIHFPQEDRFVGLDGLTARSATVDIDNDATAALVNHRYLIDDGSYLDTSVQYNRLGVEVAPRGSRALQVLPEGLDGNHFHASDRDSRHFQLRSVYTKSFGGGSGSAPERDGEAGATAGRASATPTGTSGGDHVLQIGADLHRFDVDVTRTDRSAVVLGPLVGGRRRLIQRIDFVGERPFQGEANEWAAFVQDHWRLDDELAVDLGARLSADDVTDDLRVSPRFGITWDPFGEGDTLVKGAAGLLYRRVFLGEAGWERGPTRVETTFGDAGGVVGALEPRLGGDLDAPWSLLTTLEVNHRFDRNTVVRARYVQREARDQLIVDRIEPDLMAFGPDEDPLDVLRAAPSGPGTGALLLHNAGSTTFRQLEVTAGFGLPKDGELFVSYVRSAAVGDLNDFNTVGGDVPAAIVRPDRRERLPFDVPDRILAWGVVVLPGRIRVAPVLEWRDGFPYSRFTAGQSFLGEPNGQRLPNFFTLDVQATKDFDVAGYTVRAGLKFFNVGDRFNPREIISNVASPRFGELRNSVPFQLRGKLAVLF